MKISSASKGSKPGPAQNLTTSEATENKHAPSPNFATYLNTMPNYSNPNTLATLQRIGAFIYDNDEGEDATLPTLGPYELENQAIYIG